MTTLATLETDCRRYSDAREALAGHVQDLNYQIDELKRKHMPMIKRLVARAAEHHSTLKGHLEEAPDLFEKRRTIIFHGIKIGYRKGEGRIEFPDEKPDQFLQRIRKLYGDEEAQVRGLIAEVFEIQKQYFAKLPADELKKLGCSIVGAGDQIVIAPTDTTIDKIVTALLKEATDEAKTEGA